MRKLINGVCVALVLVACSGGNADGPLDGKSVAGDLGCLACHTAANTDLAPTWNGLWGSEVELEDGTSVMVDGAYVRKSIEEPQADVVAGYGSTMPAIPMSEDEKAALVAYIESLG